MGSAGEELFRGRLTGRIAVQERRIEAMHDDIVKRLKCSTVTTVWQRLRDENGLDVG